VRPTADVLIVGSGAAGLTAALNLAETHSVAVIAKGALGDSASARAQGGIAAVLEEGDSFEAHVNDTMIAGAGLNNREVVEHVVEHAPAAIARLIDLGVPFASENGALHLTREGGHSHRRIVHVADATGWAISQALEAAAAKHPNITLVPDMVAIDLATGRHAEHFSTSGAVHGLYAYNRKKKRVETLTGRATVLATGGAGRAYLYSTAPRGATGDGIAMAWRAGCRISNMEFMQFHPTCLYNLEVKNFLITEAVRGEGGQLKLPPGVKGAGTRFMPRFDERAELAPRDIVARAIDHEIKRLGLDYVHLDISHRDPEFIATVGELRRRSRKVRPLIVGDGPGRGEFAGVGECVMTGELHGDALAQAVASADILLNPSMTEVFGNVNLEAMAAGLAVVSSNAPSATGLITNGHDGLLRTPDPIAFADAIERLWVDPSLRRALRVNAVRTAQDYRWDSVNEQALDAYREVYGTSTVSLARGSSSG
jgi:glycine/D-amino acid oxidase-like deaminating enzyme